MGALPDPFQYSTKPYRWENPQAEIVISLHRASEPHRSMHHEVRHFESRDAVARAIAQSARSRDGVGEYVLEQKLDERTTFLRWKGTIDGYTLESLERLVNGLHGLLVERTIAYRPFPSVNILRDQMRAGLGDVLPPDMWDDADSRGLADHQHRAPRRAGHAGDGDMTTSKNHGTALVTGASSGIGAIYADRLARRGYDLILVARNRERLEALAQRLTREAGRQVDLVVADLNDRKDVGRVEAVLRSDARITLLVNNAGVGSTAPLLHADIDQMEDMIAVNVTALTRLTYAAVPAFVTRGRGTIVNIASIVGVAPELLNGVYGGTKAFVLALSRSLRDELARHGRARAGRAAWRDRNRILEHRGHAGRELSQGAEGTGDVGRGPGRRRARRPRPGRVRHDPGASERGRLGRVRSRPRGAAAQPVARHASRAVPGQGAPECLPGEMK
jgi:NADP-dependent 3-hydroxy acid dehydrogenase YdfG